MIPMAATFTHIAILAWAILCLVWLPGSLVKKRSLRTPRIGAQLVVTMLIAASFALLFGAARTSFNPRLLAAPAWLAACGDALCWAAVLFAIWARVTLGRNWSGAVASLQEEHELVQSGPYAVVRHPIYAGVLCAMLGTALTIGTVAGYLAVVLAFVAFLMRIGIEEELMAAEFPRSYPAYRKRTSALLPAIW